MFGSWFDHVIGWLNAKDQDRTMYISYEEMIVVSIVCSVNTLTKGLTLERDDCI